MGDSPSLFTCDDAVLERYPAIHAGVIHATGLVNGSSPPDLLDRHRAEQHAAAERLAATPIAELPSIAAWRRAFTQFGAKPTQQRNAAEALLRRLAKHGDIPTINTLVDIGNLVSIRYALPVAAFDLAGIAGAVTVRFATGPSRSPTSGQMALPSSRMPAKWSSSTTTRSCALDVGAGARALRAPPTPARSRHWSSSKASTTPPPPTSAPHSPTSPRCSPRTNPPARPGRPSCHEPARPATQPSQQ
jgi:hypothetical protein